MTAFLSITLPTLLLCALLACAVWHDVRSRRIPNGLVFGGALAALLLHAVLTPAGGGLGVPAALAGLALGLALLLPMYMLRALGAGDVKLMAMVGAFMGPQQLMSATLLTLLAGGVLSLLVAACTGVLRQVLGNSYRMLFYSLLRGVSGGNARLDAPQAASGRLPYAIAIAAGTLLSFFWSFS
ncbi:prepilin peptidase [Janthinobacterium sp. UMAB-56]|uniref:A24 family peptidase n=1 Tax=Janthinobacterium sp. UMAB-56 TaxID=1365361 RepID=UPI001C584C19|nr:prepilin peptidase [Janthinobacterium sp. UMAB-56]